jgi:hypothetical protein
MHRRPFTRRGGVTVISAIGLTLGLALAGPGSAGAMPSGPTVSPRHGKPFVPTQGDWEGTVDGFAASFELTGDATQAGGRPPYGLRNLVMLRPSACPVSTTHYTESIISGKVPVALGRYGSLNLGSFHLVGSLTGARGATLSGSYAASGCHGRLTWHMRPASRRSVDDGAWTVRFADGERYGFVVQAGGRLATDVGLPHTVATCNGLEGSLDAFIGPRGDAAVSQSGVRLIMHFAGGRAIGTLTARGCSGAIALSATHAGG